MKKRSPISSYFLAIIGIVLITNFGCSDDFFNEKAGDRITPEQHYQSTIELQVALYGAIMPLQDIMPKLIMLDGLRSDMMDVTPFADAYLNEINDQQISAGNPFIDPSDLYKIIINLNEVLANIDRVAEKDKQADSLLVTATKGAIIGMRAWSYLTISRLYGSVKYIEDNLTTLPANLEQTVMSKEVLIDTLINQILPFYPENPTTIYAERRFGNLVNNKALLGELYLEKNDYANAVKYLKLACESYDNPTSLFKVDQTYKDLAWATIFYNADGQGIENICVIPFSSDEGQFNPLPTWMVHQYMVKPTMNVINRFMNQPTATGGIGDIYRGQGVTFYVDTALLDDNSVVLTPIITKYLIPSLEAFSSDIIISRAADIHLLLAEAYNRMGDAESQKIALMLLNSGANATSPKPPPFARWSRNQGVRGRVTLQAKTVPPSMANADSIMDLIEDFIIEERIMELAYEGKRWNDLVRIAERRNKPEYLADRVGAKFAGSSKEWSVRAILLDKNNWYFTAK